MTTDIYITADDVDTVCDGCKQDIAAGNAFINGINSCCGACSRVLCYDCIQTAYLLFEQNKQTAKNQLTLGL